MKPTLVSIHHHELNGVQLIHGDEIAPGLLTGELLDWWIDKRWCREMPERRSARDEVTLESRSLCVFRRE